jgi:DNA-binding NarL/FixJ family response regulator
MLKVLLADDHPIVLKGFKQILNDMPGNIDISEAYSGYELLELIRGKQWDIIVMDVTMPGGGVELLKQVKKIQKQTPVLILSIHPEDQYAIRFIKAGASGYLTKESAPEELIKAINVVLLKKKYISPRLAERLAEELSIGENEKPVHQLLSNREYQVMRMIAEGKTVSEIARELNLSVKTISVFRSRILEKTGLRNNAEIMKYVFQNFLAD